ncbi:MAG: arylsulfatase [Lentisphaeraceae bacterium]|nr:arylsulfatase [Lentisphaeraceae bacterium]
MKAIFIFLSLFISISAAEKPNIMIILADDLGFSDLGSYGSEIQTPNLDKLASNGLRFTQFYNTARCWPTRGALMTGYYPQQIGRDSVLDIKGGGGNKNSRPEWASLLPKYLKDAGYRSYHSGKWHIDGKPIQNGYDRSYLLKDQSRFFSPQVHYEDDKALPKVERGTGFYGTIKVANKAIEYLKQHDKEHKQKPFMAYIAFAAPHFPLHALPEDIKKVGDRYKEGWDSIRQKRWQKIQELGIASGKLSPVEREVGPPYHFPDALEILGDGEVNRPLPWNSLTEKQKNFQASKMAIHAAMIERMDTEIGRIIDQLKAMKQYENTLIMFLSDNGASAEIMVRGDGHDPKSPLGSAATYPCLGPGWSNASNTPFRRHKTWTHEGGSCTPFIAHWPKGIKSKGELRKDPGHVIDIVPTAFELAGIKPSLKVEMPGQSIAPSFTKDTNKKRSLWFSHEGNNAYRYGDWKLVISKGEKWELFNLAEDRTESNDLASSNPEKVKEMEKSWNDYVNEFRKVSPTRKGKK